MDGSSSESDTYSGTGLEHQFVEFTGVVVLLQILYIYLLDGISLLWYIDTLFVCLFGPERLIFTFLEVLYKTSLF